MVTRSRPANAVAVAAAHWTLATPGAWPISLISRFYALDFEKDFERIIDYFADEYLTGRTPNPCVVCTLAQVWQALVVRQTT